MIALPTIDVLDSIVISVACPVSWDSMRGDDRTRFCDKCSQNVHDVSELSRSEAVQLLSKGDKLPCLRIYRRPDGRIMTADCATKRERVWKWLDRRSASAAALFALVFMAGCAPNNLAGEPCPLNETSQVTEEAAISVIEGMTTVPPTRPDPVR